MNAPCRKVFSVYDGQITVGDENFRIVADAWKSETGDWILRVIAIGAGPMGFDLSASYRVKKEHLQDALDDVIEEFVNQVAVL